MDLLERTLLTRLRDVARPRVAASVGLSALDEPGIQVGDVAERLAMSRRRFIEVFTEDVGMTPKLYARVRRFQRALARVTRNPPASWAQMALECGYCDQAHLCRDWSELAGLSPGAFLARRSVRVKENHLALADGESNSSNTPANPGSRS